MLPEGEDINEWVAVNSKYKRLKTPHSYLNLHLMYTHLLNEIKFVLSIIYQGTNSVRVTAERLKFPLN